MYQRGRCTHCGASFSAREGYFHLRLHYCVVTQRWVMCRPSSRSSCWRSCEAAGRDRILGRWMGKMWMYVYLYWRRPNEHGTFCSHVHINYFTEYFETILRYSFSGSSPGIFGAADGNSNGTVTKNTWEYRPIQLIHFKYKYNWWYTGTMILNCFVGSMALEASIRSQWQWSYWCSKQMRCDALL